MKSYVAIMLLFTVGCASQRYWYQEGVSQAECGQDLRSCQATAYASVKVAKVPWYETASTFAMFGVVGLLEEDMVRQDKVTIAQAKAVNDCMRIKGYRLLTKTQLEREPPWHTASDSVSGPTSQSGLVNRLPKTYGLITDAEMAEDRKDWTTAASKFGAAIASLRQIKSEITAEEPAWLLREVEERINYCQEHMERVKSNSEQLEQIH